MPKNKIVSSLVVFATLVICSSSIFALPKINDNISASLRLRPRVEVVDSGGDAVAVTNRLQFGLVINSLFNLEGLSAVLEATAVTGITEAYNSTSPLGGNFNASKAAVVDPPVTDLTKAFLRYKTQYFTFIAGEKPINLDNQRFIGSVGWRQMPQTFGTVSGEWTLNKNTSLLGSYLYRRNGIKPEFNKRYRWGSFLLNGHIKVVDAFSITAYSYLLEALHNTFGLRAHGKIKLPTDAPIAFNYVAEYALQKNPVVEDTFVGEVNTQYYNLELGANALGFFTKAGYEVLGGQQRGTKGFSTPYATLHGFNGWSDVMLGKAAGGDTSGLKDFSLTAGYGSKLLGKIMGVYHKFDSIYGNMDYGWEIDLLYKRRISKNFSIVAKTALYQGDGTNFTDVEKYWVMSVIDF